MNSNRLLVVGLFLVLALTFSGCATNRGYLRVDVPDTSSVVDSGKKITIRNVKDLREFQEEPKSPDIPSLGFGGLAEASEDVKKRAIARKRNGYGKAMGDILLREGQTVETVVSDMIGEILRGLGYEVVENRSPEGESHVMLDIFIDKYWAWMNPGFWQITLKGNIDTRLNLVSGDTERSLHIASEAENPCQMADTTSWNKVFSEMTNAYMYQAEEVLSKAMLQIESARNPQNQSTIASTTKEVEGPSAGAEIVFWETIRDSEDPAMYGAYLKKYPQGEFAEIARLKMNLAPGKKGDRQGHQIGIFPWAQKSSDGMGMVLGKIINYINQSNDLDIGVCSYDLSGMGYANQDDARAIGNHQFWKKTSFLGNKEPDTNLIRKIGRKLGVDCVMMGTFNVDAKGVEKDMKYLRMYLIDVRTGQEFINQTKAPLSIYHGEFHAQFPSMLSDLFNDYRKIKN